MDVTVRSILKRPNQLENEAAPLPSKTKIELSISDAFEGYSDRW